KLAALSLMRYAAMVAWVAIVLGAMRMWHFAIPVLIGLPLITFIAFIPVTPGNLGVVEWTWSALLISSGAAIRLAGLFALTVRIVNVVALLMIIVGLFAVTFLRQLVNNDILAGSMRKRDGSEGNEAAQRAKRLPLADVRCLMKLDVECDFEQL